MKGSNEVPGRYFDYPPNIKLRHLQLDEPVVPDGPQLIGFAGYRSCFFCGSGETTWQHDLNASARGYRSTGEGRALSGSVVVCDDCEELLGVGDYLALARLRGASRLGTALTDRLVHIAAFCRADRGPRRMPKLTPPEGYLWFDAECGVAWLFDIWPAECTAVVDGGRPDRLGLGLQDDLRMLRSPWESVDARQALGAVMNWYVQNQPAQSGGLEIIEEQKALARQALGFDDRWARTWQRHRYRPELRPKPPAA